MTEKIRVNTIQQQQKVNIISNIIMLWWNIRTEKEQMHAFKSEGLLDGILQSITETYWFIFKKWKSNVAEPKRREWSFLIVKTVKAIIPIFT